MSDTLKHARTKDAPHPSHPHIRSGSVLNRPVRLARGVELFAALILSLSTPGLAADSVRIDDLVVATPVPDEQRDATMKAVRAFYDFWNTGDDALLKEAIAPNFTDHTLPPGRPQGPQGPAFASRQFRAAVPDLKVTVQKMILAGDYVTVQASRSPSSPVPSSRSRTAAWRITGTSRATSPWCSKWVSSTCQEMNAH